MPYALYALGFPRPARLARLLVSQRQAVSACRHALCDNISLSRWNGSCDRMHPYHCWKTSVKPPGTASQHWLLLLGCLVLVLAGCARRAPVLKPADLPVAPIVKQLHDKRSHLLSFQAVGTLRLEGENRRWSGKAFLLARIPGSLRLEMLSFFGQPVLYVASDGAQFVSWAPGQGKAFRGPALGKAIAGFIDFSLDDQEALLLLAGIVPEFSYQEIHLYRNTETGSLLLHMENGPEQRLQRVWLGEDAATVTRIERLQGKKRQLEAWFTDFASAQGFLYPGEVTIESAGIRLSIRYQQFAVNVPLDENAFHLDLPPGVEISDR